MVNDGLEIARNEHIDINKKLNRKTLFVGNDTQITNLPVTTDGQLVFSTTTGGSFIQNKLYARLTGNTSWSANLVESAEQSLEQAGTTNITASINSHLMTYFTLPSTEKFYIITGIEWKNGTTITGGSLIDSGVIAFNLIPPTIQIAPVLAVGSQLTQSGVDAVQRCSQISSKIIRAGTIIGVYFGSTTSTDFKVGTNGTSISANKITTVYPKDAIDDTAMTNSVVRIYSKVYFRGYS